MYNYDLESTQSNGYLDEFSNILEFKTKIALTPSGALLASRIGGGIIGGAGGAYAGAASAGPEATTGQKVMRGALGAGAGALGGVALGQNVTALGRKATTDYGKRQFHGLTGWMPGSRQANKGWFGQRMTPQQRGEALNSIGFSVPSSSEISEITTNPLSRWNPISWGPESWQNWYKAKRTNSMLALKRQHEGTADLLPSTSVPGLVRNLVTHPIQTGGDLAKGLLAAGPIAAAPLAMTGLSVAGGAAAGDTENVGSTITDFAIGAAPIPLTTAVALSPLNMMAGRAIGRGIKRGYRAITGQPTVSQTTETTKPPVSQKPLINTGPYQRVHDDRQLSRNYGYGVIHNTLDNPQTVSQTPVEQTAPNSLQQFNTGYGYRPFRVG